MSIAKALTTATLTGLTSMAILLGGAGAASATTPGPAAISPGLLTSAGASQTQAAGPSHWHGKSRDYQRGFQQGFRSAFGDGYKDGRVACRKRAHSHRAAGQARSQADYERGFADGYARGYTAGFNAGCRPRR